VVVVDGDDAEQLLLRAEQAVHEAKQAGRDCLFLATS
jgi:GGDEF domain-containing protein